MDPFETWQALDRKLVAILRGLDPEKASEIVSGLLEVGFRAIEVPLNSPEPFTSIERAVHAAGAVSGPCLIGAGTVLAPQEVRQVLAVGGNLVVSPNTNPAVIGATVDAGLLSVPGVFTATEALLALASGAHVLKFFPASNLGPQGIRAIQAVLPPATPVCAVGGVGSNTFADYRAQGLSCFGIGSELFSPALSPQEVVERGRAIIQAYDAAQQRG